MKDWWRHDILKVISLLTLMSIFTACAGGGGDALDEPLDGELSEEAINEENEVDDFEEDENENEVDLNEEFENEENVTEAENEYENNTDNEFSNEEELNQEENYNNEVNMLNENQELQNFNNEELFQNEEANETNFNQNAFFADQQEVTWEEENNEGDKTLHLARVCVHYMYHIFSLSTGRSFNLPPENENVAVEL